MQVHKTGTPKLFPGIVIREFKLTTAAVDRGVEGKRVFARSLIEDIDSSINISTNSSLDHHKYYYILYFG